MADSTFLSALMATKRWLLAFRGDQLKARLAGEALDSAATSAGGFGGGSAVLLGYSSTEDGSKTNVATTVTWNSDTNPDPTTTGTLILSLAYTCASATSRLKITSKVRGNCSTAMGVAIMLHKDSDTTCLAVGGVTNSGDYSAEPLVSHTFTPGDTSSHTYKISIGVQSGTFYVNGLDPAFVEKRQFGGVSNSFLEITEFKA